MRLALIPPISKLSYIKKTSMQLALPHLATEDKYFEAYAAEKDAGSYVILDNGVAEGIKVSPNSLVRTARRLRADEVVVPDVLYNATSTMLAVKMFHDSLIHDGQPQRKYMCVLQTDWAKFNDISALLTFYARHDWVTTIGIPRHFVQGPYGLTTRLNVAKLIHEQYEDRFEIHFLGANTVWPQEIREAAQVPYVRSLDTSLPFVAAYYSRRIKNMGGSTLSRPDNYFFLPSNSFQRYDLRSNIEQILRWVK